MNSSDFDKENELGKLLLEANTHFDLKILNETSAQSSRYTRIDPNHGPSMLDYILCEKDMMNQFYDFKTLYHYNFSDHFPIKVKLRATEGPTTNAPPRWIFKKELLDTFQERRDQVLSEWIEEHSTLNDLEEISQETIDAMHSSLVERITKVTDEIFPRARKSEYSNKWFNEQIRELRKLRKQAFKNYKKGSPDQKSDLWDKLKKAQNDLYHEIRNEKRKKWENFVGDLEQSSTFQPQKFWKQWRRFTKKGAKIPESKYDELENRIIDGDEYLSYWLKEFAKIFSVNDSCPFFDPLFEQEIVEKYKNLVNDSTVDADNSSYNAEILQSEIKEIVKRWKNQKAAGHDLVSHEMWKGGNETQKENVLRALHLYLNCIWKSEKIPQDWKLGLIRPIHKEGDPHDPKNYRGITLIPILAKLFDAVMNNRIMGRIEPKINPEQAGFRFNYSTVDHIYTLNEIVNMRKAKKKRTYLCFIDIKKAFDSVWHPGLFYKLHEIGIKGKLWRCMNNYYEDNQCQVLINNTRTKPFPVKAGVRQGGVTSPILYSIFMNDLIQDIKDSEIGVKIGEKIIGCLLYADDIVLLAETQKDLHLLLKIVEEHSNKWRYEPNPKKCGVLVTNDNKINRRWKINNELIKETDCYKYLGVHFQKDLKWTKHVAHIINKVNKINHGILRHIKRSRNVSGSLTCLRIWNVCARPAISYGMEVWNPEPKRLLEIERAQNKFIKSTLRLPRNICNLAIPIESGITSIEHLRYKLRLRFLKRISNYPEERIAKAVFSTSVEDIDGKLCKHNWLDETVRIIRELELEDDVAKLKTLLPKEWNNIINVSIWKSIQNPSNLDMKAKTKHLLESSNQAHPFSMATHSYIGSPRYNVITKLKTLTSQLHCHQFREDRMKLCPLCKKEEENNEHFLLKCKKLRNERKILMRNIKSYLTQKEIVQKNTDKNISEPQPWRRYKNLTPSDNVKFLLGKNVLNLTDGNNKTQIKIISPFIYKMYENRKKMVENLEEIIEEVGSAEVEIMTEA